MDRWDLALTDAEAAEYLQATAPDLTPARRAAMITISEGWIGALRAAVTGTGGGPDTDPAVWLLGPGLGVQQGKGVPLRGQHHVGMGRKGGLEPGRVAFGVVGGPVGAGLGEGSKGQVRRFGSVIGHPPTVTAPGGSPQRWVTCGVTTGWASGNPLAARATQLVQAGAGSWLGAGTSPDGLL